MTSIPLHTRRCFSPQSLPSPLPPLLQTPSGLALLELQGTINLPDSKAAEQLKQQQIIPIGRLTFPDYNPSSPAFDPAGTAWMKRVYMYVGEHQRLMGEVKKLPRAVAVVRRRGEFDSVGEEGEGQVVEELEVVEVVKYKVVFAQRPEPVTGS